VGNVLGRYPAATEEAWLDIRFPADDADFNSKSAAEIAAHLAAFCEPGVTAEVDHADPPQRVYQDRPEVRGLQQAAHNQGYRGGFLRKHCAGDARFYYQRGIDAVALGTGLA
jgi:succinyl-diaminopimelate desuccinylase